MHNPVCIPCGKDMFCKKNGVVVVDLIGNEEATAWSADLYMCPVCGNEVITSFSVGWVSKGDIFYSPFVEGARRVGNLYRAGS